LDEKKKTEETFLLELGPGVRRNLPVITLPGSGHRIASFVMLGDVALNEACARLLVERLDKDDLLDRFDMLAAIEAKGITLVHETAKLLGHPYFVVIRKSVKKYMVDPSTCPVKSITSAGGQILVLDGRDRDRMRGKRICLIEDVIATGGSVRSAQGLIAAAGARLTLIATVLLKGEFDDPRLLYLHRPPM
jgi:adenine phosphoribosyltransferase